jgi:hypothetical protein
VLLAHRAPPRLHRAEADESERGGMEERQRDVGIAETLRQRRQRIVVEEDGDNQLREKRKDRISASALQGAEDRAREGWPKPANFVCSEAPISKIAPSRAVVLLPPRRRLHLMGNGGGT